MYHVLTTTASYKLTSSVENHAETDAIDGDSEHVIHA